MKKDNYIYCDRVVIAEIKKALKKRKIALKKGDNSLLLKSIRFREKLTMQIDDGFVTLVPGIFHKVLVMKTECNNWAVYPLFCEKQAVFLVNPDKIAKESWVGEVEASKNQLMKIGIKPDTIDEADKKFLWLELSDDHNYMVYADRFDKNWIEEKAFEAYDIKCVANLFNITFGWSEDKPHGPKWTEKVWALSSNAIIFAFYSILDNKFIDANRAKIMRANRALLMPEGYFDIQFEKNCKLRVGNIGVIKGQGLKKIDDVYVPAWKTDWNKVDETFKKVFCEEYSHCYLEYGYYGKNKILMWVAYGSDVLGYLRVLSADGVIEKTSCLLQSSEIILSGVRIVEGKKVFYDSKNIF